MDNQHHQAKRGSRTPLSRKALPSGALGVILQLFFFLPIGYSSPPQLAVPANTATTHVEQWRQDLQILATELPRRHINAFHQMTTTQFQSAVNELDAAIPSLPDYAIAVKMAQIVARVGDAHTSLNLMSGLYPIRRYPLTVRAFKDAGYVTGVTSAMRETNRGRVDYTRALGARIIKIGDLDIAQAGQTVASVISAENEAWIKAIIPSYITSPEVLNALGILPDMEHGRFTFVDANGRQFEMEFSPVAFNAPVNMLPAPYLRHAPTPLYRSRPSTLFYWYEYLADQKTIYFQYNRCREMTSPSFAAFSQELLSFIDTHAVNRLVIDLRRNGGGNSGILLPFINGIKARPNLNQRGKIFVAIDNATFSSGMLNAVNLQQMTQAILIGEPTGGKPNSYGEVQSFTLPNSGLIVNYSVKFFQTVSGNPPSVIPEVLVELSAEDYLAGRDPVLEKILAF